MRWHLTCGYHLAYQLLGGSTTIKGSRSRVEVSWLIIIREYRFKPIWVQRLLSRLVVIGFISQPIGGELMVDLGHFGCAVIRI